MKKSRPTSRVDHSKLEMKEDLIPQLTSELTEWDDSTAGEGWQTLDSSEFQSGSNQNRPKFTRSSSRSSAQKHGSGGRGRPR